MVSAIRYPLFDLGHSERNVKGKGIFGGGLRFTFEGTPCRGGALQERVGVLIFMSVKIFSVCIHGSYFGIIKGG